MALFELLFKSIPAYQISSSVMVGQLAAAQGMQLVHPLGIPAKNRTSRQYQIQTREVARRSNAAQLPEYIDGASDKLRTR
jgi:hypothetical protein